VKCPRKEEVKEIWVYSRISQILFSKIWRRDWKCVCQGIKSRSKINRTKIWTICRIFTKQGKNRWLWEEERPVVIHSMMKTKRRQNLLKLEGELRDLLLMTTLKGNKKVIILSNNKQ